ncbi:Spx/MgsR family RNA polymerase-binding regulatory protein [Salinisphaera sp. T31B1]|uniref:Spx/MgsR family RNA polymerase-binding regulatory protein n=1 Tax=Salinisphaera sp. T31B1 TaxID=727963 RepID=UPI00334044DD
MVALYGIHTCDTCRKARQWLDRAGIDYRWVDVRADGVDRARLRAWYETLGPDALLNKRSKTWRDFDGQQRQAAEREPVAVLGEYPTLIKRPILETSTTTLAGFSADRYAAVFAGAD